MSARIQTNKTAQLEYNSQILDFNGQTLTFYVRGLTHWDVDAFSYTEEDMGAATITLDLLVPADVDPDFGLDWYVDFRGERFYNKSLKPGCVKDTSSLQYRYSMTFLSQRADLERYEFANFVTDGLTVPQPTSYDFTLPLTVSEFVDRFNINLAYNLNDDWSMVLDGDYLLNLDELIYDGISRVTVNFSRITLWAILTQLYDIYGLRWSIAPNGTGMTITVGSNPVQLSQTFEYGSGNGLVSIERINPDTPIYTRLSGRGSDRNVPYRYFDSSTSDFPADPDNNEFTRLIPYPNIMPTAYRDYVQGWNAGAISGAVAKSTYGYGRGYWDASSGGVFNPVDFAISPNEATYGIRKGSMADVDTTYPTIQGVIDASIGRIDEILAVEEVLNDDYDTSVNSETVIAAGVIISKQEANGTSYEWTGSTPEFTMDSSGAIRFDVVQVVPHSAYLDFQSIIIASLMSGTTVVDSEEIDRGLDTGVTSSAVFTQSVEFTDVPPGTYTVLLSVSYVNNYGPEYIGTFHNITTSLSDIALSDTSALFSPTFDIWIKNIWDTSIGADTSTAYMHRVWDPIVSTENMTVNFSDGLMAGDEYTFEVVKDGTENYHIYYDQSVAGSEWRLELMKSEAMLKTNKLYLPNKTTNASIGDHFFFTGIELPQTYVAAAEDRVQAYLENELAKVSDEFPTYAIDPSAIFLATFDEVGSLKVGAGVPLQDARLIGVAPYVFFITTLTIEYSKGKLLPKWSLTISEKPVSKSTTISLIQGDIKVLSSSMRSAQDTVAMVDAVLQQTYLKRDGTDQYSLSPTTFAKQVTTEAGMKSDDFVKAQIGGAGYAVVKDENGNWMLEIDKLNVRMSLNVNELIVNQISIYGGKHMFTAAAMTVSAVELQQSHYYVCHLDLKQGTVINQFVAGDLAYCQRYDPQSNSVIKYYWAKVQAVTADSIALEFAGSYYDSSSVGIPAVGDNIAQLGNVSVPARQSAFIIDQLNGGQCTQYAGISGFSFSGKDQVSYGYDPSTHRAFQRTYGDMYVGARDESHYLKFDSSTGNLTYRGTLSQDTVVVDSSGNFSNVTMDRGSYDASAQYFPGNTVAWLGSTYRCDVKPPIGTAPTNGSFWHVSAAKGTDGTSVRITGNMGTSADLPELYDAGVSYSLVATVIYSDYFYTCIRAGCPAGTLPTDTWYWAPVMAMVAGDGWIAADTGHFWVWGGASWSDAGQIKGDTGKGIATVTLYYLATDASTGITTASAGWTDYVQVMTPTYKYLWTYQYIVYTDAAVWNSTPAITGVYGTAGTNGLNSATVTLYHRPTGTPYDPPAGSTTYNFATGVLSGTLTPWTQVIPTDDGNPCYVTMATAVSDSSIDTITSGEWSDKRKFVANGAKTAICYLYQRKATAPVLGFTTALTYTFSTKILSSDPGSWLRSIPEGANPLYVIAATAFSETDTDSIAYTEWSTPVLLVEHGATGATLYTWIKYADTSIGGGLSDDPTGRLYIGLAYNKTTPTESTTAIDYSWSLIKGDTGNQGIQGPDGPTGATLYTWIKYSNYSDGTDLYDIPDASTAYIGIAVNKATITESTTKTDYVWSKFRGDQGVPGATGAGGVAIICDKQNLAVTTATNAFTAAITVKLSSGATFIPKASWGTTTKTLTSVTAGADTSTSDSLTINLTGFSASTTQVGYVSVLIAYGGNNFTISISVARIFNPVNVQKGLWITGTEYTGNCIQRDNVKDPTDLKYYALKPSVGLLTSATQPHSDTTRWELLNSFKNVATETLLAENANIAGFIYKDEQMVSQSGTINGDASTNWSNAAFVPNLTLDGSTGEIVAKMADISGNASIGSGSIGGFDISTNRIGISGDIDGPAVTATGVGFQTIDVSTVNLASFGYIGHSLARPSNPHYPDSLLRSEHEDYAATLETGRLAFFTRYRPAQNGGNNVLAHSWVNDGNTFSRGGHKVLDDTYIGIAEEQSIVLEIGTTSQFLFTSNPTPNLPVYLPTSAQVSGNEVDSVPLDQSAHFTFLLHITAAKGVTNAFRVTSVTGGQLLDNNAGNIAYYGMAEGDTLVLRYYDGYYYVISHGS